MKKENFKKIYLTEEAIKLNSSYPLNTVFFLKHFGINKNISQKTENFLRQLYFTPDLKLKDKLTAGEFSSLIYCLTHIIADSKYYERHVSGHEWTLKFFWRNIDLIIRKVSVDIISEVALCFKLCQKEKNIIKHTRPR